jgi:hypothetical protein
MAGMRHSAPCSSLAGKRGRGLVLNVRCRHTGVQRPRFFFFVFGPPGYGWLGDRANVKPSRDRGQETGALKQTEPRLVATVSRVTGPVGSAVCVGMGRVGLSNESV